MADWHDFKLEWIEPPTEVQLYRANEALQEADYDAPLLKMNAQEIKDRWRSPMVHNLAQLLGEHGLCCRFSLVRSAYWTDPLPTPDDWTYVYSAHTAATAEVIAAFKRLSPEEQRAVINVIAHDVPPRQ